MQLHHLHLQHKKKSRKRVGRGGKRGTYSGRGIKGQKARAGRRLKPVIRDLIKRYPKLRGYKFKSLKFKISPATTVNLSLLDRKFNSGDTVTPEILIQKKVIRRIKGRVPQVKILGNGEISKPLTIRGCIVSKQAKEKVVKAGGEVNSKSKMQN